MIDVILVCACTVCRQPHLYTTMIQRRRFMGSSLHPPQPVRLRRFVDCPVQAKRYEISVWLIQPSNTEFERISEISFSPFEADLSRLQLTSAYPLNLEAFLRGHGLMAKNLDIPPGGLRIAELNLNLLSVVG